jgi:hypothetical protein
LIDQVESWARLKGQRALTLTTFRDVPWNRPYYQRIGFCEVVPVTGTQLDAVSKREAEGFDPETRVVMQRPVPLGTDD